MFRKDEIGFSRFNVAKLLWIPLLVSLAASCSKKKPEAGVLPEIKIVSGADQVGVVGEEFADPVRFQVVFPDTGNPVKGVTLQIERADKDEPKGFSIIMDPILITKEGGEASAYAVGGKKPNYETKYRAFIPGTTSEVLFSLNTGDIPEEDLVEVEVPTPMLDESVKEYVIATEHASEETAGVKFAVTVSAVNAQGQVVPSYNEEVELVFGIKQEPLNEGEAFKDLKSSDFDPFPPEMATKASYTFVNGVATVPVDDGYLIRKILEKMILSVESKGYAGRSPPLEMSPGNLTATEIAAGEDKPNVIAKGVKIPGERYQDQSGFNILVPSVTSQEVSDYPPFTLSAGSTLAMQVNGYDQFGNLFPDPIPSEWQGYDVGTSIPAFPATPIIPKSLAIKSGTTGLNLFTTSTDALGFIKVTTEATHLDGTVVNLTAETGVINVLSNKPTTFLVELYTPTGDQSTPVTAPLTEIIAGEPVWIKLTSASTLGVPDLSWNNDVTLMINAAGTSRSPGWPLDTPVGGNNVPTLDGNDLVDDVPAIPAYPVQVIPARFTNGVAWVKTTLGPADVDLRDHADLIFFKSGEQPTITVQDVANEMNSSSTLPLVKLAPKKHIRIEFNDTVAVPAGYAGDYPSGIDVGTELGNFEIQVGIGLVVASVGYDEFGNKIGLVESDWSGDANLPKFFLAQYISPVKINIITPDDMLVTPGRVHATDPVDPTITDQTGDIATAPGLPFKFVVAPTGTVKAGEKFGYTITAQDKSGATSSSYDSGAGTFPITLSVAGVTPGTTTAWFPGGAAEQTTYDTKMADLADGDGIDYTLQFVNGVATILSTDPEAMRAFVIGDQPKISAETTGTADITGESDFITVEPNNLNYIEPHFTTSLASMDGANPVNYNQGDVVANVILNAGSALKMDSRGYDRYGNFIADILTNWTNVDDDGVNGQIPAPNYVGNPSNFTFANDSSFVIYAASLSGLAYIKMETAASICGGAYTCDTAGPLVAHTGQIDSRVGDPIALRVVPSNVANPAHVAGSNFAMKIELLDVNDQVVTSYNQNLTINSVIVNHTPGEVASVNGNSFIAPGPQAIAMINGVGTLNGFKGFNIYDTVTINVTAQLQNGNNLSNTLGTSVAQTFVADVATEVYVINNPQDDGGTDKGPLHRPIRYKNGSNDLTFFPSANLDIFAGKFDQYGNWAGDANTTAWTLPALCGGAANNLSGFATLSGSSKQGTLLAGAPTGRGCVKIDEGSLTYTLDNIDISSGVATQLQVIVVDGAGKKAIQNTATTNIDIDPGFQLKAGDPFRIEVNLLDGANQVVPHNIPGGHPFSVELVGATASDTCADHPVAADVNWRKLAPDPDTNITGTTLNQSFIVSSGKVSTTEAGYFYVPKSGNSFNVRVTADDPDNPGTPLTAGLVDNLTVIPADLERVYLRTGEYGDGDLVQNNMNRSISVDAGEQIFAAGYDQFCNYVGNVPSAWSGAGTLAGKLFGNTTNGTSILVQPTAVGSGDLEANAVSIVDVPCTYCGKLNYDVSAGTVANLEVISENSNTERVGVPFSFTVTAKDSQGNVASGFSGAKEIIVSLIGATQGPNGTYNPAVPTAGANRTYNFTNGVIDAGSFTTDAKKVFLARAGEAPTLKVEYDTGSGMVSGQAVLTVNKGPVDSVNWFDITSSEIKITAPIEIEADAFPTFAVHGYDVGGNEYGALTSDFSVTGSLIPAATTLDKTTGTFVIVDAAGLGAATLVGTFHRVGDPDAADLDIDDTLNVTVVPGKAKKFLVMTNQAYAEYIGGPADTGEVAGTAFGLKVLAVDNDNQIDPLFDNADNSRGIDYSTLTFNLSVQDADMGWSGGVPVFPATPALNFVAGIADVAGVTLFKAIETPRFQLVMDTPSPASHVVTDTALGAPIAMTNNVPHDLRIITLDAGGNQTIIPIDGSAGLIDPINTNSQVQFYATANDQYDNYAGAVSVNWTGVDDAVGMVNPTIGESTYLAPQVVGSGKLRADSGAALPGLNVYQTESITFNAGSVDHFEIQAPASVQAGDLFTVTLIAKDIYGNPVDSFPDGESFDFWYADANQAPNTTEPVPDSAQTKMTETVNGFTAGNLYEATGVSVTGGFKLAKVGDQAILHLSYTDANGEHLGQSAIINVTPGAPVSFNITKDAAPATEVNLANDTVTVGTPMVYYANGFDVMGNFAGNQSVKWVGTDALAPILLDGGSDLIATDIAHAPVKVKTALTGLSSESVTGTANVEIRATSDDSLLDTLPVTINPGVPNKVKMYLADASNNVSVTAGAYDNPQVAVAGAPTRYRLEVQDSEGNRASFAGSLTISVDVPDQTADQSLLGFLPSIDQPGSVTFADGMWFSGTATKAVTYTKMGSATALAIDGAASPLASSITNIDVQQGVLGHLRIAQGAASTDFIYQPANFAITWAAGSNNDVYAHQYDEGGNWLGLATADWSGTNNLTTPVDTADVGNANTTIQITPAIASAGNALTIDFSGKSYTLNNISIGASVNYERFLVENVTNPATNTTTADNCFDLKLTAEDNVPNVATSYTGSKNIVITVADGFTADYTGMPNPNTIPADGSQNFVDGVSPIFSFCLRDVTAGATITFTDPGTTANDSNPLAGTFVMAVTAGAADRVEFATAQRDGVGEPEAAPTCELTVDADSVNNDVYASVHDQYGNIITGASTAGWAWAEGGVVAGKTTPDTATHIQYTPTQASMTTSSSETGMGTLDITGTGLKICDFGTGNNPLKIHVEPGAPTQLDIAVNGGTPIDATQPFAFTVTALDQHGNVAWKPAPLAAVNLNFAWNGSPVSSPALSIISAPSQENPVLVANETNAAFAEGVFTSATTNRLPNAQDDTIRIDVNSPNVPALTADTSDPVVVDPGADTLVLVATDSSGYPVLADGAQYSYKVEPTLYSAKYDALGNVSGINEPATSWGLVGKNYVDGTTVNPGLVEYGDLGNTYSKILRTQTSDGQKITGAYAEITINHPGFGSGAIAYVVNAKFNPDNATKFVATKFVEADDTLITNVTASQNILSGDIFYVMVEAQDDDGNVDVGFPATFDLTVASNAMARTDLATVGTPVFNPTVAASQIYSFNYNSNPGYAKIGPFSFVNAEGGAHDITISDNDAARVVGGNAVVSNINVLAGASHHFALMKSPSNPPLAGEILLSDTPESIPADSPVSYQLGGFDEQGNYLGLLNAQTFTWKAGGPAITNITGDTTSTVTLVPDAAGTGRIEVAMQSPHHALPTSNFESPDIVVDAGAASSFVVEPMFIDQDDVTPGKQLFDFTDFPNLSTARVFADEADPAKKIQRAQVGFAIRLRAKDGSGNTVASHCTGDDNPTTTPRVCTVEITYAVTPSLGGDGTTEHSPKEVTAASNIKIRWNNGYGVPVTDGDESVILFPFVMAASDETINITVTEDGSGIAGTSENIMIKDGPLSSIKMREAAGDAAGISHEYVDANTDISEGLSRSVNAAGYDAAGNYIQDYAGVWSSDDDAVLVENPNDGGSYTGLSLDGMAQGIANITISVPADVSPDADYPLTNKTIQFNVQPADAQSYKLTLVDGVGTALDPNTDVKAGDTFRIKIEGMTGVNGTGVLASGHTGYKRLGFTAGGMTASALGFVWEVPAPEQNADEFQFTAGEKFLDLFKFTGSPDSDITLQVQNLDNLAVLGTLIIKNNMGDDGHIRIQKGVASGSDMLEDNTSFNMTTANTFHAHVYDKGGNFKRVDLANWDYKGDIPGAPISVDPLNAIEDLPGNPGTYLSAKNSVSNVTFLGQSVINSGTGVLTAKLTSDVSIEHSATGLTVTGNVADHFNITAQNAGNWDATACYNITVTAEDAANITADYYTGNKTLDIEVTLDDDTTAYPTNLLAHQQTPVVLADGDRAFVDGVFVADTNTFCFKDASTGGAKVRIKVTDNLSGASPITGFVDITVSAGASAGKALSQFAVEGDILCGETTVTASATTLDYYVHDLDAVGNFLSKIADPSTLSLNSSGALAGKLVTAADQIQLTADTTGAGGVTHSSGQNFECSPTFTVDPAPARKIVAINQNGQATGETADTPFGMTLQVLDEFDNLKTDFSETINVQIDTTAQVGLDATQTKLLNTLTLNTGMVPLAFVNGEYNAGFANTTDYHLPRAEASIDLNVDSDTVDADLGAAGKVHGAGFIQTTLSFEVSAGAVSDIEIWDAVGASGKNVDATVATYIDTNSLLTTEKNLSFFATEVDAHGNFIRNTSAVTWSLVGLPNALNPPLSNTSTVVYDPISVGTGQIQISSDEAGAPLNGVSAQTATLTVKAEAASKWKITVVETGTETELTNVVAGTAVRLKLEALDGTDVPDANFDGTFDVNIRTEGTSSSPSPYATAPDIGGFAPSGPAADQLYSAVSFTDGIGYITNVLLYNEDDNTVTFTILNTAPTNLTADTVQVDVDPAAFNEIKIRYDQANIWAAPAGKTTDDTIEYQFLAMDAYGNTTTYGPITADVTLDFTGIAEYDGYNSVAPDALDQTAGSITPSTINNIQQVGTFSPNKTGRGFLSFDCTAQTFCINEGIVAPILSEEITIDPGTPAQYGVYVEDPLATDQEVHPGEQFDPTKYGTEYVKDAGESFHVRIELQDAEGNLVHTFNATKQLTWSYSVGGVAKTLADLQSEGGVNPQLPTQEGSTTDQNYDFHKGVWTSRGVDNGGYADQPFFLTQVGTDTDIDVSSDGATIAGRTPEPITVGVGALAEIKFLSEANNAPGAIQLVGDDECVSKPNLNSGTTVRMYIAGFDAQGNYIADQNAGWDYLDPDSYTIADDQPTAQTLSNYSASAFTAAATVDWTPTTVGEWKLTADAGGGVTADLCYTVIASGATKYLARVFVDTNQNGAFDDGTDKYSNTLFDENITGQDVPHVVDGGECFSLEIQALDGANNLVATYQDDVNLFVSSEAVNSDLGFEPYPKSPELMMVRFTNGIAVTPAVNDGTDHPIQDAGHACAGVGSFVFQKVTSGTPNFILVSDGGGVGLLDADIKINVNEGPIEFVAILAAAGGANPEDGKHLGVSNVKLTDFTDDKTDPSTWPAAVYDFHSCGTESQATGLCVYDDVNYTTYTAGVDPGELYQRFYLGAYDAGGNYKSSDVPVGDWSISKTNLGESLSSDPQFSWTHVNHKGKPGIGDAPDPHFEQYVQADGTFANRVGDLTDISNINGIYYYPLKPIKNTSRIYVEATVDGETYVIGSRYDIQTLPGQKTGIGVTVESTPGVPESHFAAPADPDFKVTFYDQFNNELWVDNVEVDLQLEWVSNPGAGNSVYHVESAKIREDSGGVVYMPANKAEWSADGTTINHIIRYAKEYRIVAGGRVNVDPENTLISEEEFSTYTDKAVANFTVWPGKPTQQRFVLDTLTQYPAYGAEVCRIDLTAGVTQRLKAGAFDDSGNLVAWIKYGWYNTSSNRGIAGKQSTDADQSDNEPPVYRDASGNIDGSPEVVGSWVYSYKADVTVTQDVFGNSGVGYAGGYGAFQTNATIDWYMGKSYDYSSGTGTPFTKNDMDASLIDANNPTYSNWTPGTDDVTSLDLETSNFLTSYTGALNCAGITSPQRQFLRVLPTAPESLYVRGMQPKSGGSQDDRIGLPQFFQIELRDEFGNATWNRAEVFDVSYTFQAGTVADPISMCGATRLGLPGGEDAHCDTLKTALIQNSATVNREWDTTSSLPDIGDDEAFHSISINPGQGYAIDANYEFIQAGSHVTPVVDVCYEGSAAPTINATMTPGTDCDEYTFNLGQAQRVESFLVARYQDKDVYLSAADYHISDTDEYDRTFITNETVTILSMGHDIYGNQVAPSSAEWQFTNVQDPSPAGVPASEMEDQFVDWPGVGNFAAQVTFGLSNRLPRTGELALLNGTNTHNILVQRTAGHGAADPILIQIVEAPPGSVDVQLYTDAALTTPLVLNTPVNANTSLFATLQVKDDQGNPLGFTTTNADLTLSLDVDKTRHDNRGDIDMVTGGEQPTLALTGASGPKFCNGWAVQDAYNNASCPTDTSSPGTANLRVFEFKVSTIEGNLTLNASADVNATIVNGVSDALNMQALAHDHYIVENAALVDDNRIFYDLDETANFTPTKGSLKVYAVDVYGNNTSAGAGSSTVKINATTDNGNAISGMCSAGTPLGSCASSDIVFECEGQNCFDYVANVSTGVATINNVQINAAGTYHITAKNVDNAYYTFDAAEPDSNIKRGQILENGTEMVVQCSLECIDHFELTATQTQSVGVGFDMTIQMKDVNGRDLTGASLAGDINAKNLFWTNNFDSGGTGLAPDSKLPVGIDDASTAVNYSFNTSGQATVNITLNKITTIAAADITLTLPAGTGYGQKTGNLGHDIDVLAGPVAEYRLTGRNSTDTGDVTYTSEDADSSTLLYFKVESLDAGGNYISTPSGVTLKPVWQAGPALNGTVGSFQGNNSCTLSGGTCFINGMYLPVAALVDIEVDHTAPTTSGVQVQFNVSSGTVEGYELVVPSSVNAHDGAGNGNQNAATAATVYALDGNNNRIFGYTSQRTSADTYLGGRTVHTTNVYADGGNGCASSTYTWTNAQMSCDLHLHTARTTFTAGNLDLYVDASLKDTDASNSFSVDPNNIDTVRVCPTNVSCGSNLANDTVTADNTYYDYFLHSYDYLGNHIQVENATWTIESSTPALTGGTDYELDQASDEARVKSLIIHQSGQTMTMRGEVYSPYNVGNVNADIALAQQSSAVSQIRVVTHTNIGSNLIAGPANFSITQIEVDYFDGTSHRLKKDLTSAKTINIKQDSGVTVQGTNGGALPALVNNTYSATTCTFTAGVCTNTINLDFEKVFSAKTVTVEYDETSVTDTVTPITVEPNVPKKLEVVKATTAQTAGVAFGIDVHAFDAYDNVCDNINGQTMDLTIEWAGTTNTDVGAQAAVDQSSATTYTFNSSGVASSGNVFTLYNKYDATPVLQVTSDNNVNVDTYVDKSGWTVAPGSLNFKKIHDVNTTDSREANEYTTHTMKADETETLWAHGYDQWGNWIGLQSVTWDGTGVLAGLVSGTATSVTFDPQGIGAGTVRANTTDDVTGTITIEHGTATDYVVTHNAGASVVAGTDFQVTVVAKDEDNNTVTDYDGMKSLSWSWAGATTAPDSTPVKDPADGNQDFGTGDGTFVTSATAVALYNASDSAAVLTVTGPSAVSGSASAIDVVPANPKKAAVEKASTTVSAGDVFTVDVKLYDDYDNLTTNYNNASADFTFSWSGTTTADLVGDGTNSGNPIVDSGTQNVANGEALGISGFYLFNAFDAAPVLSITADNIATTDTFASLSGWTITKDVHAQTKIHNVNTSNSHSTAELGTDTFTTDDTRTYYAHSYDQYGNWLALKSETWAGTGILSGKVTTGPATSTTVDPDVTGTGTVTAGGDATGTLTVNPGALASFEVTFTESGNVTAGTQFGVTIQAKDGDGNDKTDYSGSKTLTMNWNGSANDSPDAGHSLVTLTSGAYTFDGTGKHVSSGTAFTLYNASDNTAVLDVTGDSQNGSSNSLNIEPTTADEIHITSSVTPADTTECTSINYESRDTYGNASAVSGDQTVDITIGGTGHAYAASGTCTTDASGGATSGGVASVTLSNATSSGTIYYRDRTPGSPNVALAISGWSVSDNQNQTITVGPVDAVYVRDTDTQAESSTASVSCTQGSTVSCPTVYAFAYDIYSNSLGASYSCPAWSYADTQSGDTPSPSNASGHNTAVSSSVKHLGGTLTCTDNTNGTNAGSTTVNLTKIEKTPSGSCGTWSACSGSESTITCTITNNTGYDLDHATLTPGGGTSLLLVTDNCDDDASDVAPDSGSCTYTFKDQTASGAAVTLTASALTPSTAHNSHVVFNNPSFTVPNAPTCP